MSTLSEFLATKPSSAEILDKLASLEAQHREASQRRDALEKDRERVFIESSDAEISAFQKSFAEIDAETEKLEIQIAGLKKRHDGVTVQEERDRIERIVSDALKASESGLTLMERYFELAEEIADIARQLMTINDQIHKANLVRNESTVHKRGELHKVLRPDLLARRELIQSGHPAQDFLGNLKLPGRHATPLWDTGNPNAITRPVPNPGNPDQAQEQILA